MAYGGHYMTYQHIDRSVALPIYRMVTHVQLFAVAEGFRALTHITWLVTDSGVMIRIESTHANYRATLRIPARMMSASYH